MNGWKYTKADGTDHYSGTVNYRENIGKEMIHPSPDTTKNPCGQGFHLGKTLRGAGEYGVPKAIFRCSYSPKDVLGEDEHKVRVSRLRIIEEVPALKGYGPRGKQFETYLKSLPDIPWFSNVGKPYVKPKWAKKMETVDSGAAARAAARAAAGDAARAAAGDAAGDAAWAAAGDAAWAAARAAAGDAAGDAAEIIGGIKAGYFSQLMEVYRAGHYPAYWDGKKLIIY